MDSWPCMPMDDGTCASCDKQPGGTRCLSPLLRSNQPPPEPTDTPAVQPKETT